MEKASHSAYAKKINHAWLIDILRFGVQGGFAAINEALSEVDRKDVKGIGISGQQHGFVPMDGDGQVRSRTTASWENNCGIISAAMQARKGKAGLPCIPTLA